MKSPRVSWFTRVLALGCTLLLLPLAGAQALDKVAISVQVKTDGKASTAKSRSDMQARSLEISLSNRTTADLANLKVKWTLFGFDLADDETVVVETGDEKLALPKSTPKVVTSKTVNFKYSRAGVEKIKAARGKTNVRRVDASGTRYAGWGVRVYQNDELVGELYSRLDLKDDI